LRCRDCATKSRGTMLDSEFESFRPHHILCVRFLPDDIPGRGDTFARAAGRIREIMAGDADICVQLREGPD